ncbi:HlyD family secretion protein [Pontimicrobium sp. IMCC45349]|uniref:HlyD family secretion protein n=1 Tax=Pontimicrobium sp. IMCC45349 TaxID=3391574 RepID=UPI0039A1AC98
MLNISHNHLNKKVALDNFKSGAMTLNKSYGETFKRYLIAFFIILIVILFLPWTQNISGKGKLTTLTPDQRPQTIQSQIPGRIEKWFVREGDLVKKGDTILKISEIKSDYFDSQLVERTGQQIKAKTSSVNAYKDKISAKQSQIKALQYEQTLKNKQAINKLKQTKLKVQSDSIELAAATIKYNIASTQFNRVSTLQKEGLMAIKDVEVKQNKLQEAQAKLIAQENKLISSKNDVINAEIELSRIDAEFGDKISKTQSELLSAKSSSFDAEAQVTKLENQYTNYQQRHNLLYIIAPQDGYINKAIKGGIGETFKQGEPLIGIMPANYDLAVETFINPIDLPLIHIGEKVRVQFDGWPAIVFSGWPNASYGTYGGTVVAIENFISPNGKYRVLLAPDTSDQPWPKALRVGSGARTIALLEDVPIWFEIWRKLNSFPPNYYQPESNKSLNTAKK